MRHVAPLALALLVLTGYAAPSQPRPQLTWRGQVAGGATIFIQGKRADIEGRTTGAVDKPAYRFRQPLPAVAQSVRLKVLSGKEADVSISEQPSAENQYTLVLDIRNEGESELYNLELFWRLGPSPKVSKQLLPRP